MSPTAWTPEIPRVRPRPSPFTASTARSIGVFAFLFFALTGGGRLTGSDEVTMLELSRALLHGGIAVPEGATLQGPDGRQYTKNTAGQAVLALPLVVAAEAVTRAVPMSPQRRELAVRFAVSFFNAIVTAILLGVFYGTVRALGIAPHTALNVTLMLLFTTPLWPCAKTFSAEPLQALGLLLALSGSARAALGDPRGPLAAGLGVLLAISVKLAMLPLALVCLLPLTRARWSAWVVPVLMVLVALAGHAAYNQARFGTLLETGYGAQATLASYTTPLWTGLYGLLLSSGKGILWFAPALWLAPLGAWVLWRTGAVHARVVLAVLVAWLVALVVYGTFEHWAGDGSFGPRYLIPLVPVAFMAVAFALDGAGRPLRLLAMLLAAAGLAVQIGGVAIYFGAQMREAGDYPYTRPLNDPLFMHESHFVPRASPILGHWRMLLRNGREHLDRQLPKLSAATTGADSVAKPRGSAPMGGGADVETRVGVSEADQQAMLHALDFWWLYALYAGVPWGPLLAVVVVLLTLTAYAALRMLAEVEEEVGTS
jgi:hypothetical protein